MCVRIVSLIIFVNFNVYIIYVQCTHIHINWYLLCMILYVDAKKFLSEKNIIHACTKIAYTF